MNSFDQTDPLEAIFSQILNKIEIMPVLQVNAMNRWLRLFMSPIIELCIKLARVMGMMGFPENFDTMHPSDTGSSDPLSESPRMW